jgi:hypothetical protein
MRLLALIIATMAALIAAPAWAGPVTGSESIAGIVASTNTGDITTATSVHFSEFFDTSGPPVSTSTGDFLNHIDLGIVTGGLADLNLPGGLNYSIGDVAWGNFTGNLFNDVILPGVRTDYFAGLFTPGLLFSPGETANVGTLIVSFTQVGGPGTAVSASLSLSTVSPVPEPNSLTIAATMGLGVIGLTYIARRQHRKPILPA